MPSTRRAPISTCPRTAASRSRSPAGSPSTSARSVDGERAADESQRTSMKYTLQASSQARALAERLSLRQAMNQVCCPLLNFEPSESLGGAHIPRGTREKIAGQTQALRAACASAEPHIPPLCTADLECGPGRAVLGTSEFPDLMGLGANDSEQL